MARAVAGVSLIEPCRAFEDRFAAADLALPASETASMALRTAAPSRSARLSRLLPARFVQSEIAAWIWSSVNRMILAAATAAPKMLNTGPAWNPRAMTVGIQSAAIRSITS